MTGKICVTGNGIFVFRSEFRKVMPYNLSANSILSGKMVSHIEIGPQGPILANADLLLFA